MYTHFRGFTQSSIVKTDRKRIQLVVLNLLSNSIKFNNQDGKILILVEKMGVHLRISVIDTGVGIPKVEQGSIFDQSLRKAENGSKLGLMISKMIVDQFDGEIDFVSKFRSGSTFFFTFQIKDVDLFG